MSELPAEYFRHAVGRAQHNNTNPDVRATHLLGPTLAALFSATFASGTIPDAWATATVTPLFSAVPPWIPPIIYRPMAVGVPLARLYANILNCRITPYLEEGNLRAQGQAGFRSRRSVNHNHFVLQHVIDRHTQQRKPLYCCFADLTAAFDCIPRHLLWEHLRSRDIDGKILRAIQAFCNDAKIVVKARGHVGNSTITTSGVRQGCPLSPTLFGVYIDALEGWLHDRVPLAGFILNTPDGGTRLLASLIYADDIVLMDGDPDSLQKGLDSFAAFCTAYGLNKTQIMQFLPARRRGRPPLVRHAFMMGNYDLETVDVYKYLGVSFCCSGNPAEYMPVALRNLEYSARRLEQQYGGMACGNNIQLQLGFFDAYVTSSAMFGGELWGVHPRAAGKRKKPTARYAWLLKKFAGVGCKTPTKPFLLELGWLSLEDRWQQSALRFWKLVALPEDDLYRDVLFDSVATRTGFARGLQRICSTVGHDLVLRPDQPRLHRLDCAAIMQLKRQPQWRMLPTLTHAPTRPRALSPAHTGDGSGAAICSSENNGGFSPA